MNLAIWIALIPLLLGSFFAACHIALKTFSRKRLIDQLDDSDAARWTARLDQHLMSLQLLAGILRVMCSVGVILAVGAIVQVGVGWQSYVWAFVLSVVVVSVFHVVIPLSWARYRQEHLLAWALPILWMLWVVLGPAIWVLSGFDPVIRRISGVDLQDQDGDISDDVLATVADHESAHEVDDEQKEMLEAVFELPSTSAGEIMTPRTDIQGIELGSSLEDVKQAVLEDGHSRMPVYEESLDHIVGILYAKDLLTFLGDGKDFDLRQVLREVFLVPQSKSVSELLREFKQRKVHLAIVLDEYGGTAGLVTIEDILEEIVGEIQDEYEEEDEPQVFTPIDPNTFAVEARMNIDDLEDELKIDFPQDGDYDTLGGFIFATLGHIPENGEFFEYQDHRFTVTEAQRTRVNRVEIRKLQASDV